MSSIFGRNFRVGILGDAAGNELGVIIEGLEPRIRLNLQAVRRELDKYAWALENPIERNNICRVVSGVSGEETTGEPLWIAIENPGASAMSGWSHKDALRPGTSDFGAYSKYGDGWESRGGGHYSQRVCVALCVAGAVAKQMLSDEFGVVIGSHIAAIAKVRDHMFDADNLDFERLEKLSRMKFPLINEGAKERMFDEIAEASGMGDTLGGTIECGVINLKSGIGEPLFDGVQSKISGILFSIPQACGVSFGIAELSKLKGSSANDPLRVAGGAIRPASNNYGGLSGGFSNGMPLVFRTSFAPPPDITHVQQSVDVSLFEDITLNIKNNFGTCLIPALIPVVEGAAAIALMDMLMA